MESIITDMNSSRCSKPLSGHSTNCWYRKKPHSRSGENFCRNLYFSPGSTNCSKHNGSKYMPAQVKNIVSLTHGIKMDCFSTFYWIKTFFLLTCYIKSLPWVKSDAELGINKPAENLQHYTFLPAHRHLCTYPFSMIIIVTQPKCDGRTALELQQWTSMTVTLQQTWHHKVTGVMQLHRCALPFSWVTCTWSVY